MNLKTICRSKKRLEKKYLEGLGHQTNEKASQQTEFYKLVCWLVYS